MRLVSDLIQEKLADIYGEELSSPERSNWANEMLSEIGVPIDAVEMAEVDVSWSEQDIALITYGDSIQQEGVPPLKVLHRFLVRHFASALPWVHLLPFFPWTSDDGFAVLDYSSVNPSLGDWTDVRRLGTDFRLMADVVINHCSSRSVWFENFRKGIHPGRDYFFQPDAEFDVSNVVRPRTSPLLTSFKTAAGEKSVWCTFSADQVDFDFRNPRVLLEFIKIIRFYLDQGVRVFRLDAVAFLWKATGTKCINLQQTHCIVKLLRQIIEAAQPDAVIITETNVPNSENLSYFGSGDEAHAIYNFALPPLLLHTFIEGSSEAMTRWLRGMPPAFGNTAYFNFLASHDGFGLRPVEGILSQQNIDTLASTLQNFGALLSWRRGSGDEKTIYEINIAPIDAFAGTAVDGRDTLILERFVCAHAIVLSLEGIPAFYIHSILGTPNDMTRVKHTGHNRAINRHQWNLSVLEQAIETPGSIQNQVLTQLKNLFRLRKSQKAFHPNATQFTLDLGSEFLGLWRQSQDRRQSVFCIFNITNTEKKLRLSSLNLIVTDSWTELISGTTLEMDPDIEWQFAPYDFIWLTNL